ncbi:MAG: DUF2793 domain-containing protein [Nitrospinae bacterium]|nr:DUF2793 domain-containing protein [Nitrospinota bacterium]
MSELSVSQGSKEITHNEALRVLDTLVNSGVEDKDLTAPPGSPANGALYIVAAGATGAWASQDGKLAQYYSAAWYFHTPKEGWIVYIKDEDLIYVYNGSAWTTAPPVQRFVLTFQYSGLAVDEETIIDGIRFQAAATVTKIGLHAREAPSGAALTVDILQDSAEQSRVATLADGATKQITDITDINFSTSQDFGLKIKSVGSTTPGNELTIVVYGQYQ